MKHIYIYLTIENTYNNISGSIHTSVSDSDSVLTRNNPPR